MIYFSNFQKHSLNPVAVSIVRKVPKGFNGLIDKSLAPDLVSLIAYKQAAISQTLFKELYLKKIESVKIYSIIQNYDECVLLCYCGAKSFCHRHILREYLASKGVEVKEI